MIRPRKRVPPDLCRNADIGDWFRLRQCLRRDVAPQEAFQKCVPREIRPCFCFGTFSCKCLILLATPTRFERATYRLGICRSILLSYGVMPRREAFKRMRRTRQDTM